MKKTKRHIIIPDVQAKPGHNFGFLEAVGNYIAEKKPDVIVQIGDFADMSSLSSYDKGKKSFEGRRYKKDIEAAQAAMSKLMFPIDVAMQQDQDWKPRLILTLGNHENRINRAIEDSPQLDGVIGTGDLQYDDWGWAVYPFLVPVSADGVVYCHYFVSGPMGRAVATAQRLIATKHQTVVAGHQQGRQIATGFKADGSQITAIIAGSCYEHDEDYMGPQANKHWRGIVVLNEVKNGTCDEMFVSLAFLKRKYR